MSNIYFWLQHLLIFQLLTFECWIVWICLNNVLSQRIILIIIDWSTYFFTFSDISLQCQIKLLNFCINTQHYICTDISILLIQALILPHHLCAHLLTDSSYHTYFEGSFDKTDLRKLSVRYDAIPNMYFFLDNAKNNYWYVFVYVFTCIWY